MNRPPTAIRRWTAVPVLIALAACSGAPDDGDDPPPERPPPAEAFQSVEDRFMEASSSRVDFVVTATGAVEVDLTGHLVLGDSGRARLEGAGTFAGQEVDVLLVSDGERMRMTNEADTAETATPPALKEALVLGLTRMGVLHNLARLTELAPPDHADGGAAGWVEAVDFRREDRGSVGFDIVVSGEPSGSARLFLSPGVELPGERHQTVEFPEGEMRVTELYGTLSVGAGAEPSLFALD